jgi:hypothetical protein
MACVGLIYLFLVLGVRGFRCLDCKLWGLVMDDNILYTCSNEKKFLSPTIRNRMLLHQVMIPHDPRLPSSPTNRTSRPRNAESSTPPHLATPPPCSQHHGSSKQQCAPTKRVVPGRRTSPCSLKKSNSALNDVTDGAQS